DRLFSRRMACPTCGISVPEMTPRAFSFNSPHGACPSCQGLGAVHDFDPGRVIDDGLSLADGAVRPWAGGDADSLSEMLEGLRATFGIDPEVPFAKLPKRHRDLILNGAPGQRSSAPRKGAASLDPFGADFEGVLPNLRRRFEEGAWADQETLEPYRSLQVCGA